MNTDKSNYRESSNTLLLFITGDSPRSQRARYNLTSSIKNLGLDTINTEEIDLIKKADQAREYGIFATPALVSIADNDDPQVIYGDLSDTLALEQFLAANCKNT